MSRSEAPLGQCDRCDSLSVEDPHWLDDAYSGSHLTRLDTGVVQRNLDTWATVGLVMRLLGLKEHLDWGAGDGLLVRFIRDGGWESRGHEPWGKMTYAPDWRDDGRSPDLITAFEVFEHFLHPEKETQKIFSRGAPLIIIGTETWEGQGRDWGYLAPTEGQHIFFWSRKALTLLGERWGYRLSPLGRYWAFWKPDKIGHGALSVIGTLLSGWLWHPIKSQILTGPAPGVSRDWLWVQEERKGEGRPPTERPF